MTIRAYPRSALDAGQRLRLAGALVSLPDLAGARVLLFEVLAGELNAQDIRVAKRLIPAVLERAECVPAWLALLGQLDSSADPKANGALELALLFALERREVFLSRYDALAPVLGLQERDPLAIVARRWRTPMDRLLSEPRVIGIGLPKTATTSLAAALRTLGYFHADHHDSITNRYVTAEDSIFFDSVTDCGASHAFETLYQLYLNARFVWTTRPLESWLASLNDHHRRYHAAAPFDGMRVDLDDTRNSVRFGLAHKLTQFAVRLNAPDAATAHRRHAERVTNFFIDKPLGKLLRFSPFEGDGWSELCGFLGQPIPAEPFPRANVACPPDFG